MKSEALERVSVSMPQKSVKVGSPIPAGNREWLERHGIVIDRTHFSTPGDARIVPSPKKYFKNPLLMIGVLIICLLPVIFYQQHHLENQMHAEQSRAVSLNAANLHLRENLSRISRVNEVQRAEMQRMVGQFQRTRDGFIEQAQGLEKGEAIANAFRHVYESEIGRMSDHYDLEVETLRRQVFQKEQMIASLETSLQAMDGVVVSADPMSNAGGMTNAIISAVNQDFQFVIVSIGALKGAKLGQMVELYHRGALIGHGQVEKVYPDFSGVKVFSGEVMVQLEKGDEVFLEPISV